MIGFVVRRLRGRLPLATAVLLTVLITTTTLTALLAFTHGVGEAGLRQALTGPGAAARTAVLLSGEHAAQGRAADDGAVRSYAAGVFGDVPVGVESLARSRSYGLPGTHSPGKEADLTLLASLDRSRVRLLAGGWPGAVAAHPDRIPVAVPQAALARLGLTGRALPAEVRLDDRYGGPQLGLLVTGVYRAAEPEAPYWRLDPLGGREVRVGNFVTYGPLLVDDSAFTAGAVPQNSRASLLTPDLSALDAAGVEAVRARATAADAAVPGGLALSSELPTFLGELNSGLRVARSTLLVGALQLAVLASAALVLVAHLLTERQEPERVLLTARGASRRRLGVLTAIESSLLAAPAALLAPLLAPPLLRLAGRHGPLSGMPLATGGAGLLWGASVACALICVLLTALPSLLRGASAAALRIGGRRQAAVSRFARSGADLALVVLAVLAHRQLVRYSGSPGSSAGGSGLLDVDPVLVAAPTLALCAGTLLVLRLLPYLARLGGRIAARGRGLGPALVGWQFARRPGRSTGPVLLLVLAVSMGVLSVGTRSTWSASQHEQADFTTAGGLRVTGSDLAPLGRGGRYASVPGGDRMVPVVRAELPLPDGKPGELLALDAAGVAARVPLRPDLRDGRSMTDLFAPLAEPKTAHTEGMALPGHPQRVDVEVSVRTTGAAGRPRLGLLLADRFGLTQRTAAAELPTDGRATITVDLASLAGTPLGSAAAPLRIAGFLLSYDPNQPSDSGAPTSVGGELSVHRISASDTPGGPAVPVEGPAPTWRLASPPLPDNAPAVTLLPAETALARLGYRGSAYRDWPFQAVLTTGGPPAAAVPGVATHAFLTAVGASVGDVVPVRLGTSSLPVRITSAVKALPTAAGPALAVDLGAAGRLLAATEGADLPAAEEWWLPAASAADPLPARAAVELRAGAGRHRLLLREEVVEGLLDDPLSAGPQTALGALAVACAVLSAIGFAASAAAAGRRRAREQAVLLALGASRRRLAVTAAAEGCLLVGLGTVVGLGLGAALVHLVVPLVVLTPAGARPVPEVLVDLPATATLWLAAAVAAVPLLSAVLGGRGERTVRGAAARLRYVEEM
ncbi:FtsX-like permease family protein [Streptomyces sp. NPDC087917]|uniref:FtsX-like permease family protein n=1 Tax=Streptomyces sp. NPDC087917 TaxID=3155060 RepID=UPI0034272F61